MEGEVLALVGDVGRRGKRLAGLDQPDLVAGRAVDGRPADQSRVARERGGNRGPTDVEAEARAPRGDGTARKDRAHACEEGKRIAGDPRQRHRHGQGCALDVLVLEHDPVLAEHVAGRDLKLVAHRATGRRPRKGRRPGEGVRARLVGAEQERVEVLRRDESDFGLRGLGARGRNEGERGKHGHEKASEGGHKVLFGRRPPRALPRSRDTRTGETKIYRPLTSCSSSRAPAANTSASSPVPPTSCTDAGRPSSAGPHGRESAGQPRQLNG